MGPFLVLPLQHSAGVIVQTASDRETLDAPKPFYGLVSPLQTITKALKTLCSVNKEIASTIAECEATLARMHLSQSLSLNSGRAGRNSVSDMSRDGWTPLVWFDRPSSP